MSGVEISVTDDIWRAAFSTMRPFFMCNDMKIKAIILQFVKKYSYFCKIKLIVKNYIYNTHTMKINYKLTGYESPEVKVVDIHAEGVLCSSFEDWQEGDDLFDWE